MGARKVKRNHEAFIVAKCMRDHDPLPRTKEDFQRLRCFGNVESCQNQRKVMTRVYSVIRLQ